MSHSLVRFIENVKESEMVVPSNWLVGKVLYYPRSIKNKEFFSQHAHPQKDWNRYSVTKIKVTGDKDTCDRYEFTSSDEAPNQKICEKKMSKPLAPTMAHDDMESSAEEDPPLKKKPSKRKMIEESEESEESEDSEEHVTPQLPQSKVNKTLFSGSLSTPSSSTQVRADPRVSDKFPMDNGSFQYLVVKLLTEIRDSVKGGPAENIPDEFIMERMATVEDVNVTEDKLLNKSYFEKFVCILAMLGGGSVKAITKVIMNRLLTNICMAQYSFSGKSNNIKLDGLAVHKLICESVRRSAEKQKLTCTLVQVNKHVYAKFMLQMLDI